MGLRNSIFRPGSSGARSNSVNPSADSGEFQDSGLQPSQNQTNQLPNSGNDTNTNNNIPYDNSHLSPNEYNPSSYAPSPNPSARTDADNYTHLSSDIEEKPINQHFSNGHHPNSATTTPFHDDNEAYYKSYTGQPNRESVRFADNNYRNSRQSAEMRHQQLVDAQLDELEGIRHTKSRFPTTKLKKRASLSYQLHNTSKTLRRVSQKIPVLQNMVHKPKEDMVFDKERTVYFNQPLPDFEKDAQTGALVNEYPRNKIRTTKYTPLNFIPMNIYHQFHNIANIYFLFIVILGAFPIFGVLNPGLAAVPIIAIVIITAIKDAIEDYRRTALDLEVNNTVTHMITNIKNNNIEEDIVNPWRRFKKASTRTSVKILRVLKHGFDATFRRKAMKQKALIEKRRNAQNLELETVNTRATVYSQNTASLYDASLRGNSFDLSRYRVKSKTDLDRDGTVFDRSRPSSGDSKFSRAYWKQVNVGDIVKIYNDDEIPADVIILSTSDEDGACYIETRNLDGETNLKVRQALNASQGIRHARDLEQTIFKIDSEAPHPDLYSYSGVMKWEQHADPLNLDSPIIERAEAISISNMLLRGCKIRNTKWVIGIVVYSGEDTKIMKNSGVTPTKRSRLTRELNIYVVLNFFSVFILSFVTGVVNGCSFRTDQSSKKLFEFGSIGGSPAVNGIITFWAAVILLQNLIPISLYITIEIVKSCQAFFIYSDCHMYYAPIDYPCTPKSWSISDDLGQIEYIFSDKTGTLTQNVMEFKKCTINGVSYGRAFTEALIGIMKRENRYTDEIAQNERQAIADDKELMLSKLRGIYDSPYVRDDDVTFVSSEIVDQMQGSYGPEQAEAINHFLLVLALCHSVLPEKSDDGTEQIIYKAQSPDEAALVNFARDMGYAFMDRTRNDVIVDEQGAKQQFTVLNELEFNSARKRMSVIIRMKDTGRIFLFCKGADNIIFSRLTPNSQQELRQTTSDQLSEFANEGLRTLCIAEKEISEQDYHDWAARHELASQALQNREDEMERVADEMERDLFLLGGTAIEDRLQEGVPETIELLSDAGIKLWVLTGDKVETAINIGYSCNLLDSNMELLMLRFEEKSIADVANQIEGMLQQYFNLSYTEEEMKKARSDHSIPSRRYAVVIDGDSLDLIMDPLIKERFVLLCKQCRSVLCCRVSPSQKALVVSAVKTTLDVTTLSIGDGANDVAMIQEADVGVGIAGLEGRQAVMSSDYGFGQFRFLSRLLLVHGRWAYRRLAEMIANLFYKNVVFTLTLFWYDFNNNFDVSYLFDYTYITLFNLAFTSLPVIFMGFLDQDVNDKISLAVPELYRRGILRKEWTQHKFWCYTLDGFYQSAVCYWLTYPLFFNGGFVTKVGQQINYREAYGVFVATSAIISCDLYVMINEYMWDWVFMLIVGISILLVFFWTGIYTCFQASAGFYRAAPEVYGAVSFWAYLLMAPIVCLLPRWTAKSYQKLFLPRDIDIIREQWMIFHRFDDILGKEDDDDQEKGDWDSKGMDFEKNRPANRDDIGEDQMIEMEQDHRNELDSTSSTNGKGRGSEGNIFYPEYDAENTKIVDNQSSPQHIHPQQQYYPTPTTASGSRLQILPTDSGSYYSEPRDENGRTRP